MILYLHGFASSSKSVKAGYFDDHQLLASLPRIWSDMEALGFVV